MANLSPTVNKMIATQHAYPPDNPVTQMDMEIKSQFHESTVNVPELEIHHVRDVSTVSLSRECQACENKC